MGECDAEACKRDGGAWALGSMPTVERMTVERMTVERMCSDLTLRLCRGHRYGPWPLGLEVVLAIAALDTDPVRRTRGAAVGADSHSLPANEALAARGTELL
eukprot:1254303-Rhodomonas_salina.1